MDYTILGQNLRAARMRKKYSLCETASIIGITPSFLGHIERGSRRASLNTFLKVCDALHISADVALGRDDLIHQQKASFIDFSEKIGKVE